MKKITQLFFSLLLSSYTQASTIDWPYGDWINQVGQQRGAVIFEFENELQITWAPMFLSIQQKDQVPSSCIGPIFIPFEKGHKCGFENGRFYMESTFCGLYPSAAGELYTRMTLDEFREQIKKISPNFTETRRAGRLMDTYPSYTNLWFWQDVSELRPIGLMESIYAKLKELFY